jgi:hypothetical protein
VDLLPRNRDTDDRRMLRDCLDDLRCVDHNRF